MKPLGNGNVTSLYSRGKLDVRQSQFSQRLHRSRPLVQSVTFDCEELRWMETLNKDSLKISIRELIYSKDKYASELLWVYLFYALKMFYLYSCVTNVHCTKKGYLNVSSHYLLQTATCWTKLTSYKPDVARCWTQYRLYRRSRFHTLSVEYIFPVF